jgi:Sulfotransferase family
LIDIHTDACGAASVLSRDRLIRQAVAAVGSADFGDIAFHDALEALCRSAVDDARLQGPVLDGFADNILRLLKTLLSLAGDRKTYPEIARQQIVKPLIVTGLPRSGTTILQALLAQDPAARSLLKWEVDDPSPPPRAAHYHDDPRIALCEAGVARLDPQFLAMHAVAADLPDECNAFMTLAFCSPNFGATTFLPSYMNWLIHEADMRPAYAFHRQFLQHMQAFNARDFWVLKAPPHLYWLDTLLATYPDARIVMTHRDPAEIMPSNASLIAYLRSRSASIDPLRIGAEVLEQWGHAIRRAMAFRSHHMPADQFFDTQYRDFIRAPLDVVQSIYEHFGIDFTPQARAAMTTFLARNRQGKHGTHVYSPEDFGMAPAVLHERFRDYIAAAAIQLQ